MSLPRGHIQETLDADAKLKSVTPIIQTLYIDGNVPAWLVSSILEQYFNFEISQGCLRKRFVKKNINNAGVKKRTRTKNPEERREEVILSILKSIRSVRFTPLLRSHPRLQRYRLQEKAIYSISQLLGSMFVQGSNQTWKSSPVGFVRPDGTELSPDKWRAIEAYCDSVSTMLRCNQIKAAQLLLNHLIHDLEGFIDQMDPLFLGRIWKLAMLLHGFDRRAPHLQAVSTVLRRMRNDSYTIYGPESPVADILDCIMGVEETDFKITIRIGFQETLKSFDDKVSDENIMTLNLWSTYAQYFCKPYVKPVKRKPLSSSPAPQPKTLPKAKRKSASESPPYERLKDSIRSDILLMKLKQVRAGCFNSERISSEQWRQSDACVRVSHYFAYTAFWVCGETDEAADMARDIIQQSQPIMAAHPVWSGRAMAFTVANRIRAANYRRQMEFRACESTLLQAIGLLRTGDNTCRIRAIGLCLTLSSWKREWGDIQGSQQIDDLLLEIQGEIEGYDMCQICRPNLKCGACSRNRSNCLRCQSTRRRRCRICKGAGQRRRNTIKARRELVAFSRIDTSDLIAP
ncbi:hypothetical protein IWW34DRAFT_737247 [Fusarium oxysporum f. sp. albedinis]|nr:hypothetical protein IWW34DRAFT_737247 [Fusarium oxysporum f. sp. albedinis]KAJ0154750.1 Uncharacterized protein HZ326_2907 [Fusarium oxysporum f. sp. albedinis]KAK2472119.1 hypothetical protein H9L39_15999 [Fusarium oxysporum f. sp. albedinis]